MAFIFGKAFCGDRVIFEQMDGAVVPQDYAILPALDGFFSLVLEAPREL